MNKLLSLTEVGNKEMIFYYNGKVYKYDWFKKIPLDIEEIVSIGIDQSSTSTGIAIVGENTLFMTELKREDLSISLYRRALIKQMETLFLNLDIDFFIYEEHGAYITPLESVINRVTDSIKEYTKFKFRIDTEVSGISPSLWRSGFLTGSNFKNRFRREEVKTACVEKVLSLHPEAEAYTKYCSDDYDAFEAYGIVKGYKNLNFDSNGTRIINRTMKKDARRKSKYLIHKVDKHSIEQEIERLVSQSSSSNIKVVKNNPDIFMDESINRISGLYKDSLILYDECPEFCSMILRTGEVLGANETYVVQVVRTSARY